MLCVTQTPADSLRWDVLLENFLFNIPAHQPLTLKSRKLTLLLMSVAYMSNGFGDSSELIFVKDTSILCQNSPKVDQWAVCSAIHITYMFSWPASIIRNVNLLFVQVCTWHRLILDDHQHLSSSICRVTGIITFV